MSTSVGAPLAGTVTAVTDVPDPVFSGLFVGPGVAVDPDRDGEVTTVAPISGTVAKIHPHAFVIVSDTGRGVLVHLGLDTVQLAGQGFTVHVAEGATVSAGQEMITWNPGHIEAGGLNPIVPVIALEASPDAVAPAAPGTHVAATDTILTWD